MALINTLDSPSEFDAAAKLRPGEPYFMLIGRDKLAPGLILRWASYNRRKALAEYAAGIITAERRDDELRKSSDAELIAWAMQEFKKGWAAKSVQPADVQKTTYSGVELPEETQKRDRIQRARTKAAEFVSNAASELNALVDILIRDGDSGTDDVRSLAEDAIPHLRQLADTVKMPRPVLDKGA